MVHENYKNNPNDFIIVYFTEKVLEQLRTA
jgi:hypothetical protein